jgi:hypothetical protein
MMDELINTYENKQAANFHLREFIDTIKDRVEKLQEIIKTTEEEIKEDTDDKRFIDIIKVLNSGKLVALTEQDAENFCSKLMKRVGNDELVDIPEAREVEVNYQFKLGGYKWRDCLDVKVVDDIDNINETIENEVPLSVSFVTEEDLLDEDPDYDSSKVDIDLSEAGNGVYHTEDCVVVIHYLKKNC